MLQALENYIRSQTEIIDVIITRFDKTLILNKEDDLQASIVLWNPNFLIAVIT